MATKVLVDTDSVQTLTNKSFASTSFTGSGTVLTAPVISNPVFSGVSSGTLTLTGATLPSPILSGTTTGTVTIGTGATLTSPVIDTPDIVNPDISDPIFAGTATGTYTLAGTLTILNPVISGTLRVGDTNLRIQGTSDPTKEITFEADGATTATVLTLATIQSTSQTLTVPNITAADTVDTLGLAQTVTAVKTMTGANVITHANAGCLIQNPAATFKVQVTPSAEVADRVLTIPLLGAADTIDTLGLAQTVTGLKTMSGNNIITHANTGCIIQNPANTFTVSVVPSAEVASRTLTIPLLGAADTLVTLGLAQAITGVKTMTNPTTAAGTTAIPSMTLTGGTNLTSALAGAVENDAIAMYLTTNTTDGRALVPARQQFRLTADGSAITTVANYFGATSNISLVASAYYHIDIYLYFLKTTTEALTITLLNSAAPTSQNIFWEKSPDTGIVAPPGTATLLSGNFSKDATASRTIATAALTTAVDHYIHIKIELQNGAGTSLKIQATNPAGSITPRVNSYWTSTRIPTGNTGTFAA